MLEDNILMLKGMVVLAPELSVKNMVLGVIDLMEDPDIEGLDAWEICEAMAQILVTGHYHYTPSTAEQAGDTLTVEPQRVQVELTPEDIEKFNEFRAWLDKEED